jgi:K+-sensing histidine kinase KdpD
LDFIKARIDPVDKVLLEDNLSYIEQGANMISSLLTKVTTWCQMQNIGNQLNHGTNRTELSGINAQIALEIAKKYHRINDLTLQLRFKSLINLSPELIKACYAELIDNAFKFSNTGDHVRVTVNSENMKCIVSVSGNGNRFCANELKEYVPFTQLGKKVFEQQDLGIGINISKSIAGLVKGEIEFLNNKPQGIIVKVSIPINE